MPRFPIESWGPVLIILVVMAMGVQKCVETNNDKYTIDIFSSQTDTAAPLRH